MEFSLPMCHQRGNFVSLVQLIRIFLLQFICEEAEIKMAEIRSGVFIYLFFNDTWRMILEINGTRTTHHFTTLYYNSNVVDYEWLPITYIGTWYFFFHLSYFVTSQL